MDLFCAILCQFIPFVNYVVGTKLGFGKKKFIFSVTFFKNTAVLNFLVAPSEI